MQGQNFSHDEIERCTIAFPGMTTASPVLPVSTVEGKVCRPTPVIVIVIGYGDGYRDSDGNGDGKGDGDGANLAEQYL